MPPVCSEDDDSDNAPFDPDKAPPDSPETLNLFDTSATRESAFVTTTSLEGLAASLVRAFDGEQSTSGIKGICRESQDAGEVHVRPVRLHSPRRFRGRRKYQRGGARLVSLCVSGDVSPSWHAHRRYPSLGVEPVGILSFGGRMSPLCVDTLAFSFQLCL